MNKFKQPFVKFKQPFVKFKQPFVKYKRPFPQPRIQSGDRIDYRNMTLIIRFISQQGKILSRRVTKLTLKQQRLMTIAIKQARILSSIPFLNNEKLVIMKKRESDERRESAARKRRESAARKRRESDERKRRESDERKRSFRNQKK